MVKIENGYRISYDELADTLYINVLPSVIPEICYMDNSYILVREYNNNIIGITIIGFKERYKEYEDTIINEMIKQYFPTFEYSYLNDIY